LKAVFRNKILVEVLEVKKPLCSVVINGRKATCEHKELRFLNAKGDTYRPINNSV
jgi:hypothetical protein